MSVRAVVNADDLARPVGGDGGDGEEASGAGGVSVAWITRYVHRSGVGVSVDRVAVSRDKDRTGSICRIDLQEQVLSRGAKL